MRRFALFLWPLLVLQLVLPPILPAAVPVVTPEVTYTATGSATSYAFLFRIFAATDLVVTVDEEQKTLGSHYNVTGVNNPAGGTVAFTVAPAAGAQVKIVRTTPLDRTTDYTTGGPLRAATLNADLDRIVTQIQDLDKRRRENQQEVARALKFPAGDTTDPTLPPIATRAGKMLAFDPAGVPSMVSNLIGTFQADVTVENVASLRSLPATQPANTIAIVLGYYAASDGGGGPVRVWKSGAASGTYIDNGGSVIVPTGGDGSGAWVWEHFGPIPVAWFGAISLSDHTTRIQAAINASTPGGVLLFHYGTFQFSALNINKPITLRGTGPYTSVLRTTSATADALTVTTQQSVVIEDMTIGSTVTRSNGAYVKVDPGSSVNADSVFRRVHFSAPYVGINFVDAADWTIEDCYFPSYTIAGIQVRNVDTPDSGDSTIVGSTFDGGSGTGSGIVQYSSGGLRIQNNKFLGGAYHYVGQFDSNPNITSILLIQDNSSENAATANFALNAGGGTTFSKVLVQGNQFSVKNSAIGLLVSDPGYAFVDVVSIGGNQFALGDNAQAVNFGRGNRVLIEPNLIVGNGAGTSGVTFGNVGSVDVYPQSMFNLTSRYSGVMTNVNFFVGKDEAGTVTGIITSTPYGGLYISALQTVTFAVPYAKAPKVSMAVTPGGGAVSIMLGTVTPSGFEYYIISVTNGGSCAARWTARG